MPMNGTSSSCPPWRIGTRASSLARRQAELVAARLADAFPALRLTMVALSSPGDRDRSTDLKESPPDFFTRDLDAAVLAGELDAALHCAKDLPLPPPPGLDWWWLPWHEDARDVLVFRHGEGGHPPRRIGVSSERRAAYCRHRFPGAELASVRGNIDDRLRQLDEGRFDLLILAGAGLLRLGLADRIGEWLSPDVLPVPEGQGILALTFRVGDRRWQRLRACFLPPVVFAGAGPGTAELLTRGAEKALRQAEVCLVDALVLPAVHEGILSPKAMRIDVGKRGGGQHTEQSTICGLLADHVRKERRVVRLKGGDPGLFGRLAEETEHLDGLGIPYRVLPGVSSLLAATTGTGLLLTRRDRSRAFLTYTPRQAGSANPHIPLTAAERARPATAVFMGSAGIRELVAYYLAHGWERETPSAIVLAAGTEDEHVCQAPLGELADIPLPPWLDGNPLPGLILLGEVAANPPWPHHGPLGGCRVLFTGSRMLADRTVHAIRDRDGIPLPFSLLELEPDPDLLPTLACLPEFDWLALGSPAAAEILLAMLSEAHVDLRRLPKILVAGPATAAILAAAGIFADLVADPPYGVAGLRGRIAKEIRPGQRILRLRSELADTTLADLLADAGAKVDDAVLYRNRPPTPPRPLPDFDAILFASDSAVKRFHEAYGAEPLHGKMAGVIGEPTRRALAAIDARPSLVAMPRESTSEAMVDALAQACVNRWIDGQSKEKA
jgi:uroporphyrinogen III methyltransferase/synthase